MRLLVCGSRDWPEANSKPIHEAMLEAQHSRQVDTLDMVLIHGGAPGVDSIAAAGALEWGWRVVDFPAAWNQQGRSAGPRRNQRMLDVGNPHLVLAFPLPGSVGTRDMMRRAKRAGIQVVDCVAGGAA